MKWISKLVDKITHSDFNLNSSFYYYGHEIHCQSGTRDYLAAYIGSDFSFSFDFWLKKLVIFTENKKMEKALIQGFQNIYKDTTVIFDYENN